MCWIAHVAVRKHHQPQDESIIPFTRTILESAKLFFLPARTHFIQAYDVWNPCIYCKYASVCFANWIALSVKRIYCMPELYWKQLWNEVRVKIILILSSCWWRFVTATCATLFMKSCCHLYKHHLFASHWILQLDLK